MKKQMYGIIGLCSAAVLLGGGVLALKLTDKSGGEDSSSVVVDQSTFGEGVVILEDSSKIPEAPSNNTLAPAEAKTGTVKSVKITKGSEVWEVVVETPAKGDTSAVYTLKGYDDVALDNLLIGTLANNINGLTAASIVEENCDDFSKFGLGDDAIKAELTYESGVVKTLYIGDASPVTSNTYVRLEGCNIVFTVPISKTANFKNELLDFISKTVLEKPEKYEVESLRIERDDLEDGFLFEYNTDKDKTKVGGTTSKYIMTEPVESYITEEKVEGVIDGMFGLSASSVYAVHCTESDIAETGLSDAYCTVTMKCKDGQSHVLLLSEKYKDENGTEKCYGMLEGGKVIYTFNEGSAVWLGLKPADAASRLTITSYIWNISKLTLKSGSNDNTFTIDVKDGSKERPDCTTKDMTVKLNGKDFDASRFQELYSVMTQTRAEEFAYKEAVPSGEPMVSLSFTDAILEKTYTYDFYDYSSMKCLIVINGESRFLCGKSFVKALAENAAKADTFEELVTSWKD